ncbi:MAG: DUF1501 domain-containing protein [Erythrobacter sp.]
MTNFKTFTANRRSILGGTLALGFGAMAMPRIAFAQSGGSKNLLFVLLRGAADGMEMLAPIGDPGFDRLRPEWNERFADSRKIGGLFAIHPALEQVSSAYGAGEALFVHATATSYRERSHFDGQNLLETGGMEPYASRDGWMNRLVGMIPGETPRALAVAPALPLAMRGSAPTSSYAPSNLPDPSEAFLDRVSSLYADDDQLAGLWQSALETQAMAGENSLRNLRDARAAGELTASLMRDEDGAKIGMIELGGWDSHAGQAGQFSRMATRLDALLGAYRASMGESWNDTLVLVATEFGRTARVNGTNGTDHGTGGAALLLGGNLSGGRIIADWPGLREGDLFEGRDLMPTTPLESVLAGAAAEHLGLDPQAALATLFPGRNIAPLTGLSKG